MPDYGTLLYLATERALDAARRDESVQAVSQFEGLREALRLLMEQADHYGFSRDDIGVDPSLDLNVDLRFTPTGRYAG